MGRQHGSDYAFSDTDAAAARLRIVANVFEPDLEHALQTLEAREPWLAVDLGCGPGYTTRTLAAAVGPRLTIGLDTSRTLLQRARAESPARVSYLQHDVASGRLPCAPTDLLFARFLLTHLAEPERVIRTWASGLQPGGSILIVEIDEILTEHTVLEEYLRIAEELIAIRHGCLYVGRELSAADPPTGTAVAHNIATTVRVASADAARMFGLNLAVWRNDPHIRRRHAEAVLDSLAHDLEALTDSARTDEIVWSMRHLHYVKHEPSAA